MEHEKSRPQRGLRRLAAGVAGAGEGRLADGMGNAAVASCTNCGT